MSNNGQLSTVLSVSPEGELTYHRVIKWPNGSVVVEGIHTFTEESMDLYRMLTDDYAPEDMLFFTLAHSDKK